MNINKTKMKRKSNTEEDQHVTQRKKWKQLEHNGPYFPPSYEPLPNDIEFIYDNTSRKLSPLAEEIAILYAKMTKEKYLQNETFQTNFFESWKDAMTEEEKSIIIDLKKCNFENLRKHFQENKKSESKDDEDRLKNQYGTCRLDNKTEHIENFKVQTTSFFLGRGNNKKTGKVKRRIEPKDVTINGTFIDPEKNKAGWDDIVHYQTVSWICKWKDEVAERYKYVRLKSKDDQQKFLKAKKLDCEIVRIREQYLKDLYSNEEKTRDCAVALYLIDRFGFRIGNKKKKDEAETFGCCSLQAQHIKLCVAGNVAIFDFPGKSSVRYYNKVSIHEKVFKILQRLKYGKSDEKPLFNQPMVKQLESYVRSLKRGLTVKVFRTYNASCMFEEFLQLFADYIREKMLRYECANLAVAVWCNHQKTVEYHDNKLHTAYRDNELREIKKDLHEVVKQMQDFNFEFKPQQIERLLDNLKRLLRKNKKILTRTSKDYYLDPRIIVAWCEKFGVKIEKIFTKKDMEKFAWAIKPKDANFKFSDLKHDEEKGQKRDTSSSTAVATTSRL